MTSCNRAPVDVLIPWNRGLQLALSVCSLRCQPVHRAARYRGRGRGARDRPGFQLLLVPSLQPPGSLVLGDACGPPVLERAQFRCRPTKRMTARGTSATTRGDLRMSASGGEAVVSQNIG